MTIDEAIVHCEEVARSKFENSSDHKCIRCGEEHLQLAIWLKELKKYKNQGKKRSLCKIPRERDNHLHSR